MADKVAEAIRVLREAGRSDLLAEDVRGEGPIRSRPQRKASEGVAAALWACSPPRTKWRRVGEEPHYIETALDTRAAV